MKKQKKMVRRVTTGMLALTLLFTMQMPISMLAEEVSTEQMTTVTENLVDTENMESIEASTEIVEETEMLVDDSDVKESNGEQTVSNDRTIVIEEMRLDGAETVLTEGQSAKIIVKAASNGVEIQRGMAIFRNTTMDGYKECELVYKSESEQYEGTFVVDVRTTPGIWKCDEIQLVDSTNAVIQCVDETELTITVEQENYDVEAPIVKSISLGESQGKTLTAGDTVEVTMDLDDNSGKENLGANVTFYNDMETTENTSISLYLSYDSTSGLYKATYQITEETYPCEWHIGSIMVSDTYGNYGYGSNIQQDEYFFRVVQGDESIETTTSVHVECWALDKNEKPVVVLDKILENVTTRTTIKQLIGDFPVVDSGEMSVTGWTYRRWQNKPRVLDENTEIYIGTPFDGTAVNLELFAVYDKYPVTTIKSFRNNQGTAQIEKNTAYYMAGTSYMDIVNPLIAETDIEDELNNGMKFIEWSYPDEYESKKVGDAVYNLYSSNLYGTEEWISVTATYDKYPMSIYKTFIDENGELVRNNKETILYSPETTFQQIIETLDKPQNPAGAEFEKWQTYNYVDTTQSVGLNLYQNELSVYPVYKGKSVIEVFYGYETENGWIPNLISYTLVDGETLTKEEAIKAAEEEANRVAKHREGLELGSWLLMNYDNRTDRYLDVGFCASYKTHILTLVYPNGEKQSSFVKDGEEIVFPENAEGYTNLEWYQFEDFRGEPLTKFIVTEGDPTLDFYAKGTVIEPENSTEPEDTENPTEPGDTEKPTEPGDTEKPTEPEDTEKPTKPEQPDNGNNNNNENDNNNENNNNNGNDNSNGNSNNSGNNNSNGNNNNGNNSNKPTEKPPVSLTDKKIENDTARIERAKDGHAIQINMQDATVVPKEFLEAAKGKDVDVVLKMGDYEWKINGKDIAAADLKNINLAVEMDTNAVPPQTVQEMAKGQPVKQISLAHNGEFGFKATLSINVGNQYKGQYGNLYYYDSTGKLVFQNAGIISPDGTVSVEFSHASDYLLVISATSAEKQLGSPKTEENSPVLLISFVMLSALALLLKYGKKMKRDRMY